MKYTSTLMTYIRAFLSGRPFFFSFIRPTEAALFYHYRDYLKSETLDFGCGDGFFLSTVFPNQHRMAVGVDVLQSRMNEAEGLPIYSSVVQYDGNSLPFEHARFDAVISNSVLEHISNEKRSVEEIYRVLQPGGVFLTSVMTTNWERSLIGSWLFGSTYRRWLANKQAHVSLRSPQSWIELFEATGFEIDECHGYLAPGVIRWMELAHYLSWPSIVMRALTGHWVWPPQWYRPFLADSLVRWVLTKTDTAFDEAGSIFVVLRKPS